MFQHVSTCFYWTTFDGHTEFPFEIKKRTAKCNHIYFPFFLTRIGFRPRLAKLHSFHPQVLFSRVLLGLRGLTGFFFTVLPCSCDVYTAFIGFHWRMWCGSRGHRRCGCRGERGGGPHQHLVTSVAQLFAVVADSSESCCDSFCQFHCIFLSICRIPRLHSRHQLCVNSRENKERHSRSSVGGNLVWLL